MSKNEAVRLRILKDFRSGLISRKEAATLLGCRERSVTRRVEKIRRKASVGIKHGNYQRAAVNRIDDSKREDILAFAKNTYFDCNMIHSGLPFKLRWFKRLLNFWRS